MASATAALSETADFVGSNASAASGGGLETELAGVPVRLDAAGALWLEASRTLVVSDLHFEKGSAYAARGVALPPYDTRATIARLAALATAYAPDRLISLGDGFHDVDAGMRMSEGDLYALAGLVARVDDWVWIAGNHDPAPPPALGGRAVEELAVSGLVFRHEPTGAAGEVSGHLHPCARVRGRGRSVRRRCFASDGERMVLPAFGAFTGGLNVCDPAFAPAFPDRPPHAHVLGAEQVWSVAWGHLVPDA
ncbi:MAG: ligase-associated DNA damage response endonuclease PdeM [Maricaulaceae bacterium]